MEVGSSRSWSTHDVFISFKPEDSDCFVRFLYEELYGLGMMAFEYGNGNDMDENLTDPTQTLVKAIEESRSSIVVLSQNYASSHWCLTELTKILERMDMGKRTNNSHPVLPIFYEVDPFDLRTLSGSFKKSFEVHEQEIALDLQLKQFTTEVQIWKNSIKTIGAMPGFVVSKDRDEVNFIKLIAKEVFDWLGREFVVPNKYKSLLEIWPRLDKMNKLLDLESNEVRFVGIVGMGGIGKTTIAQVVYEQLSSQFLNNRCFLYMDDHKKSLMLLQHQLLSEFLLEKEIKIENEDDGIEMIKNHLSKRKVLIVLDDVNEKTQLEKLVGSPSWFGAKSRVIITTRNRDILHQHNLKGIKIQEYNVSSLSNDGALKLFCQHAFHGGAPPDENFKLLTEDIVEKVKGLPLALKVTGSYLSGRSKDIWKKVLNDENLVFNSQLFEILKTSYEALDANTQEIFLDLVCFFNEEGVDIVKNILETLYGTSVDIKIKLLVDRYFIEIVDGKIHIEFLILSMGRRIMRGMFSIQEGKRRRVWNREDVFHALKGEKGLNNIHGIGIVDEEDEELELDPKSFLHMPNLKILAISNVKLRGDHMEFLSNELRVLKWPEFPLKHFPSNFQPQFMVQLILPRTKLERLWEGKQHFEALREIDVRDSKYLAATPDFSCAPNLERLILRNCSRLSEIHPSISTLCRLVFLDMGGCVNLRRFPSSMICSTSPPRSTSNLSVDKFQVLKDSCSNALDLHRKTSPSMSHLTYLNLKNCKQLSTLPTALDRLTSLITLNLNGCNNLVSIPPTLWTLNLLEKLDIGGTKIKLLVDAPLKVVFSMKSLRTLNFENLYRSTWGSFTSLFTSHSYHPQSIRDLNLSNCNLVDEDIPNDLRPINTLEILDLSANHFVRLSESLSQLINLKALYLNQCKKIKQLPKGLPRSLRYVSGLKSMRLLPNYEGSSSTCTSSSPLLSNNNPLEEPLGSLSKQVGDQMASKLAMQCSPLLKTKVDDVDLSQQVEEKEYGPQADTNINKMGQPKSSNLVGMEDQLDKVYDLLDLERRNEVIFVGIFGMSGIDKTSLARVVYEKIADKFESSCFLHISKQSTLASLQHQLLSQLSKAAIKVGDKNYGEESIKKYISGRKVLIVLDGVDEEDQIEKLSGLARSPDWFSPGSRVIITSSNRKVLSVPTYEDKILEYNVALLSDASALELFSKHAFRHDQPPDDHFKDLSHNIIRKLEKLPLALRAIGSFLYSKDINIWKETLTRLSKVEEDFRSAILSEIR